MSIRITETAMSSDRVPCVASWDKDRAINGHLPWVVSWIPERLWSQPQAITAMVLAEEVKAYMDTDDDAQLERIGIFLDAHADELHLDRQTVMQKIVPHIT